MKENWSVRKLIIFMVSYLAIALSAPVHAASLIKPGAPCSKVNLIKISGNYKFTCIKKNKKLVWNQGVKITKATSAPTPSPSPTPSPLISNTPTPTISTSPTPTPTFTQKPTPSPSTTPTAISSATPSASPSASSSPSPTPSPTVSPSPTPTSNPSPSQSAALPNITPQLKLLLNDMLQCQVEITNYDSRYTWSSYSGNLNFIIENKVVFAVRIDPTQSFKLTILATQSGVEKGSTSYDCPLGG